MIDPIEVTLASYQAAADRYRTASAEPSAAVLAHLDRLAALSPGGHVLELGSGPGRDAAYLESCGLRVERTDATPAFVEMARADGHGSRLLDLRYDTYGGPYDAVLANAVLHHLERPDLAPVLLRCGRAVRAGGLLAFSTKLGDGAGWTEDKIGLPRHFTYWQEDRVREVLADIGWTVLSCEQAPGRQGPWLYVIASWAGRGRGEKAST